MTATAAAAPALVVRRHVDGGVASTAVYSPCGRYRYALTRVWDAALPRLGVVMLNPSTADEHSDDPTVARCVRRARDGGWGAVRVGNLFALRETSPQRLRRHAAPEGPDNDAALARLVRWSDAVLAAWGVHGAHRGRGAVVAARLRAAAVPCLHLGLTAGGHPRHPLYLSYRVAPRIWD